MYHYHMHNHHACDICQHVQDTSGRLDAGCGHLKLELLSTTLQVQVQVQVHRPTLYKATLHLQYSLFISCS